jgi:hypothetical protein
MPIWLELSIGVCRALNLTEVEVAKLTDDGAWLGTDVDRVSHPTQRGALVAVHVWLK